MAWSAGKGLRRAARSMVLGVHPPAELVGALRQVDGVPVAVGDVLGGDDLAPSPLSPALDWLLEQVQSERVVDRAPREVSVVQTGRSSCVPHQFCT